MEPAAQYETSEALTTEFGVYWPPVAIDRALNDDAEPLLSGNLTVVPSVAEPSNAFQLYITLQRPTGETARASWNRRLAFPEHDWMSQVRVWDDDLRWLWPNLPYLLRAYGEERVERYGGIDPGKGIDNDFAAVLIRPLDGEVAAAPLVSAEWHAVDGESVDVHSVVHRARSDTFTVRCSLAEPPVATGKLSVWLIYADFLGARLPRNWPQQPEYDGGILAYFEIAWQRTPESPLRIEVKHQIPPSATGFDWAAWSTTSPALKKRLQWKEEGLPERKSRRVE